MSRHLGTYIRTYALKYLLAYVLTYFSFKEPELRQFLLQRAKDGYCFPINPVWPLRDPGWYEVLHALKANSAESANLAAWLEPRVMERIEAIHTAHPGGFEPLVNQEKTGYDKMRREVSSIRNCTIMLVEPP